MLREDPAAGFGEVRRARVHGPAERLDHDPAVGLLVVRRPHLPDLALQVELRARERQRGPPLPGTRLGGQPPDAGLRVVERLRHRRVRLVRAGRRDPFVLVVDPGRGAERLLQTVRAVQRARSPQPVDVEHLVGDVEVLVRGHLLQDQVHREQRREVVGTHRLAGAGVQHGRRRRRQVVQDVVPAGRHLALVEQELVLLHLCHRTPSSRTGPATSTLAPALPCSHARARQLPGRRCRAPRLPGRHRVQRRDRVPSSRALAPVDVPVIAPVIAAVIVPVTSSSPPRRPSPAHAGHDRAPRPALAVLHRRPAAAHQPVVRRRAPGDDRLRVHGRAVLQP